jgi:hypothetical protein
LWYARYDGEPSFSDFRSFGGWTKPVRRIANVFLVVCYSVRIYYFRNHSPGKMLHAIINNTQAIKQFSDAGKKCGASYDINWYAFAGFLPPLLCVHCVPRV